MPDDVQAQLDKLDPPITRRCIEFITSLADRPERGQPLSGPLAGYRKGRVGDYRVVYKIDAAAHAVNIDRVAHRSTVYGD